ncbi:hypothetical protein MUP01_09990 [Candidatus Bathyarchaeota archaeon]|jgi:hypothetical protein|nr:hypothetical protein [Candidatus Bathyarchaeota archaeon]
MKIRKTSTVLLITVLLITLTVLPSFLIQPAFATTTTYIKIKETHYPNCTTIREYEIYTKVSFWQKLLGVIKDILTLPLEPLKKIFTSAKVPSGWTYTTDGETYLNVTVSPPITEEGVYGPYSWETPSDISQFNWETYGPTGNLLESGVFTPEPVVGGIVVPVDKFGLLAPYIGLASTAMIGVIATAVYVKRAKRRKEKQ